MLRGFGFLSHETIGETGVIEERTAEVDGCPRPHGLFATHAPHAKEVASYLRQYAHDLLLRFREHLTILPLSFQLAYQLPEHLHLLPLLVVVVADVVGEEHECSETRGVGIVVVPRAYDTDEELHDQDVIIVVLGAERILQLLENAAF